MSYYLQLRYTCWLVRSGSNFNDLSVIYQGPHCKGVVSLPDEIFIIVPQKMCDVQNPELHRGFLAVLGESEKK